MDPEKKKDDGARDALQVPGMIEIRDIGKDELPRGSRIRVTGGPKNRTPFFRLHSYDETNGFWLAYPDSNSDKKRTKCATFTMRGKKVIKRNKIRRSGRNAR